MEKYQLNAVKVFDDAAMSYSNTIGKLQNYNHTYDYLLTLMKENQLVLDLACGPGNISYYLLTRIKINIIGIDLSKKMLKIAQNLMPDQMFINNSI